MDYREAVAYIEEIPKFTKKHSIAHTREFLKRLGDPQKNQKVIHVAGTNGKGSVCAYMQAMLLSEEKHVGFFTSPHLVCINERIRIDNRQVDDDTFLDAFLTVKKVVDEMERDALAHPSYFEFLFGMGMTVFAKKRLDYIILETGLGGRLDATNAIEHPILTIITSISLDHTQYLGDTMEQIAGEKAGIIKEGVPLICDGSNERALAVIKKQAKKLQAECREISKTAYEILEITDKHIAFSRRNAYDDSVPWQLKGCGIYQAMNASIAILAMEYLTGACHESKWKDALAAISWEGRMEEILPEVFIDGAHNPGAIEAFAESINRIGIQEKRKPPVILFAAVEDKEYQQMVADLCGNLKAKLYVVTEVEDQRKIPAEKLGEIFSKYTKQEILIIPDIWEAFQKALAKKESGERMYCLGSLYLAGTIKEHIDRRNSYVEF